MCLTVERVSGLVLQEPHLVPPAVRFDGRVVAAAQVLFALEGGGVSQRARQTRRFRAILALAWKTAEPPAGGDKHCWVVGLVSSVSARGEALL